jgi:hypothetical protein
MRFLGQLKPRERATQRAYADWARNQDGAPWPKAFGQHGGWAAVRAEGWERLRAN